MKVKKISSIYNATILTPDEVIEFGSVKIRDGFIVDVSHSTSNNKYGINAKGQILVPGFIDLQINGAFGYDFTSDPQSIWRVAVELPRYGVSTFLPTIITAPLKKISEAQLVLEQNEDKSQPGAIPLGLHLEGPYLNPLKKGAHNAAYLRTPSLEEISEWTVGRHVRLVTLAPELEGALTIIKHLTAAGVLVGMGHSMATYEQAKAGFDEGARYATHLFNAMPSLDRRKPGLTGMLLDTPGIITGIIVDGIHVHPAMVRQAWKVKGQNLNLVTDAISPLGMQTGEYPLGDQKVIVTETDARLRDGTLAGSILSLDSALRKFIEFTGCSLQEALPTITTAPSRLLGIANEVGRIAPGYRANLTLLDENYIVIKTIINGEQVFEI